MLAILALAASASAATPSDSQNTLYQALMPRHLEQSCAELATLSPTPTSDLIWLAENATQPSWVAIRAAECVLELDAETAAPALTRWMQGPNTLGLALTTVQALDTLPMTVAQPLLEAGLKGALADEVRPRALRLTTPALRQIAEPTPKP